MTRSPRYSPKVDQNQVQAVKALRAAGWIIVCTHGMHRGFPDLIASKLGYQILIELKFDGGDLTLDQETFWNEWQGDMIIADSPEAAVRLAEQWRNERGMNRITRQ